MSNNIHLIDSHIHLDNVNFRADLSELLTSARHHHVYDWIIPATISSNFDDILNIQQHNDGCYAALGLHPYFIHQHKPNDLIILESYIKKFPVIAIGECGLDAMMPEPNMDKQLEYFKAQIKLALTYDLPLIIHTRKTVDLVLKEIRKHPKLRGVLHSFSGSMQQAEIALQHNFLLGFGGSCTFPRAQKLQKILRNLSLNDFIIETDAPFQRGAYRDNGLNYPSDLLWIAKSIANTRNDSLESIAAATTYNTQTLFKL